MQINPERNNSKLIAIFFICLSLVACVPHNRNNSVLSDSIQTSLSNVNINIHSVNVYGTIEFLMSSPKEIKDIRLNTNIDHRIRFERFEYQPEAVEVLFLLGIDFSKDKLSENDQNILNDYNLVEKKIFEFAQSSEVKNYYFYNVYLDFDNREDYTSPETITEMIVTTDEEMTLDIGSINIMPFDSIVDKDESLSTVIKKLTSQMFGKKIGFSRNRRFDLYGMVSPYEYVVSEDVVIDKITHLDPSMTVEKMKFEVQKENNVITYNFNNNTIENMNLILEKGNEFSIDATFYLKENKDDLIFMQSYDFIIHYRDKEGNKLASIADSGYLSPTKFMLAVSANDEIKENIRHFYFDYLPRLQENIPNIPN